MKPIDLQIHTNASDGDLSPEEIIDLAVEKDMLAIAITDHNTTKGLPRAIEYSKEKDIEFVPGVEINCKEEMFNSSIDILGLFIDYKNLELNKFLKKFKESKIEKPTMVETINIIKKSKGIPVLAHPGRYLNEYKEIINNFIDLGGRVIETDYPYTKIMGTNNNINKILQKLVKERDMLNSGGSDFHGKSRASNIGDAGIYRKDFKKLKRFASKNKNQK